jgi:uncharacterized protein GlcG (DUF336 family)
VRTERNMSLELANQICRRGTAACAANGYNVTATVVDRAGSCAPCTAPTTPARTRWAPAQAKAFTSASAKNTTLAMMEGAQKNPAAANLVHIPGYLLLGGGVPVRVGNEVIGAVGVGGAPGGHLDEQCAVAALDKVPRTCSSEARRPQDTGSACACWPPAPPALAPGARAGARARPEAARLPGPACRRAPGRPGRHPARWRWPAARRWTHATALRPHAGARGHLCAPARLRSAPWPQAGANLGRWKTTATTP